MPDDRVRLVARLLAKDPQDRPASAIEVYEVLAPFRAVEAGIASDVPMTMADGRQVDPTMPCRHPFGPLPPREPAAPGGAGVVRPRAVPEVVEPPSLDELAQLQERVPPGAARVPAARRRPRRAAETRPGTHLELPPAGSRVSG
ncbi:hypothetical protein [Micromonospora sp. NBRC 110038]|uniref:hypothetical protein n=1 Tax=Micromonospora sp. NBRC 110038 TaxID=1550034 RepID=UPI001E4FF67B|nr:hypothetical protein [Micromonospora sp. NBRC 110038]